MVIREMFESNLTHVVAILSYPIRFLLGAHSDDIINQDWTFFLKEEHVLADVSAHDEVQNCNVIVTIYFEFVNDIFMYHASTGMGRQGGRVEWGKKTSQYNCNLVVSTLVL